MYARVQAGSAIFVFNTHLQASHRGAAAHPASCAPPARQLREFVDATTRHSRVPWVLAGDFNVAVADQAVADAFGYLCDTLPQESDEFRQMQQALSSEGGSGAGSVRDLLKERRATTRRRGRRAPVPAEDVVRVQAQVPAAPRLPLLLRRPLPPLGRHAQEGGTRLVEFETAVPAVDRGRRAPTSRPLRHRLGLLRRERLR